MENFFNWLSKPIPKDEITTWFNVHNMYYERIELYGDIFKSLNQIIIDTYLGSDVNETKIVLSEEDNVSHFDWCWKKTIESFRKDIKPIRACHLRGRCCITTTRQSRYGFHYY